MATRTGTRTLALAAALAVVVVGCSRQPQATPMLAPTSQPVAAPAAGLKRGADAAAADRVLRQRVEKCPVTIANGNGPPGEGSSPDYHGNGALWTALPPDGIDKGGTPEPDGSTSQKYPWWTVGHHRRAHHPGPASGRPGAAAARTDQQRGARNRLRRDCWGPLLVQRDLVPDRGLLAGHGQGRAHQPDIRGVHGLSLDWGRRRGALCP